MDRVALDFVAAGRVTRRYHAGLEMLEYQRIDAHSYGVAMFTVALTPNAKPKRRARLLMASLVHDLPEQTTGDMPAPFKRSIKGFRDELHAMEDNMLTIAGLRVKLNPRDKRVLAIADSADGLHHCIVEMSKGNSNARKIALTFIAYLQDEQQICTHEWKEEGEGEMWDWLMAKYNDAAKNFK